MVSCSTHQNFRETLVQFLTIRWHRLEPSSHTGLTDMVVVIEASRPESRADKGSIGVPTPTVPIYSSRRADYGLRRS